MIILTFIRSLIFNIIFYSLMLLALIVLSVFGFLVPNKVATGFLNSFALPFFRFLLHIICGLKIEVRGKENIIPKGAIYASKHQSAMETYFISSIIKNGATFIFKKELTMIPFFGWAVKAYGSVPVDRSGGSRAMKNMLTEAKKLLKKGRSIVIFPEGTRTKVGETRDYKPGIAFMYQNIDAPVIPVAHNAGFFWQKHSFLRHPGKVIIEFLKPIEKGLDKKEFMAQLQNAIEEKCVEINQETIEKYPYLRKRIEIKQ